MVEKKRSNKWKDLLLFSGPTLFIFFTVVILPFLYGIYLTFTNWNGVSGDHSFVGLQNYLALIDDTAFWTSLYKTIKYVMLTVILINVVGFFLAYILTSEIRGRNVFRAGFFTPNLIGGIILGFLWQFIFSSVLVYIGKHLGAEILSSSWLADPDKAFWALVIVTTWQYSGYMMVIYIAGLMNVPKELLEAASIDGANAFIRLRKIVLPLMVPSFIVCVFLSLQRGFMVYDLNVALTNGGPYKSTQLVSMYVYQKAFLSQQYGIGQAEAFVLFLIVALVTLIQVYISKKREVEA